MKLSPIVASIFLTACASQSMKDSTKNNIDEALSRADVISHSVGSDAHDNTVGSARHADRLAREQSSMPVLRRSRFSFIGTQTVPVTSDDRLPSVFRQEYSLAFDDNRAGRVVSIATAANRLSEITGVPIRIQPDVYSGADMMPAALPQSQGSLTIPAIHPIGAQPQPQGAPTFARSGSMSPVTIDVGEMRWKGTLTSYLNHLTDRLGLAWEYRDNTIIIMRFISESHEVATFHGSTEYSMNTGSTATGTAGSAGAQSSAANGLGVTESGKADPLASIERTIERMISTVPGSSVTRSDGSGRLLVKTTREMQSQVRDYIRAENTSMLRQAQIQFDIYSVRTDDNDERGINWSGIFNSLSGTYGARVTSPQSVVGTAAGNIGLSILNTGTSSTSQRFGDSSVLLALLSQHGTNVQHRPVSLLALNRTWARKSRLNTEHYLAETTPGPASSTGVGAPGLKTDEVTTGDQYVAYPHILDNNAVLLKFGVSLSDLLGLFDVTVGEGLTQQKVQAPRITAVSDQYSIKLEPGQVMAITGLSRLVTTTDRRSLGENVSPWFGGSKKTNMLREHFVIFVRPVIL